jgi:[phosphatase 2A protein]-leucine-carboxy methyltransferase
VVIQLLKPHWLFSCFSKKKFFLTESEGSSVRHLAVTRLVDLFLETTAKCQIISLGAGSDTRPFSLLAKYNTQAAAAADDATADDAKLIYHELDFAVTATKKALTIYNSPLLSDVIYRAGSRSQTPPGAEIHTPDYHLHAIDLRTLNATTPLLPGMDPTLPTLVISECCLCYLQPDEADQVFSFLVTHFGRGDNGAGGLGMILYEPIGGNDAFGQVMIENLAMRGISLPTLQRFPTLQAEVQRLADRGLGAPRAADMMYIYERWITREEQQRISRLEFLDELEELRLLLSHYCVAWTVTPNSPAAWVDVYATQLPYQV